MSRSSVSPSGSPYVLTIPEYEGPEFDDPEKPVFSVATPAGERFDTTWIEQVAPEGEIEWHWPGTIPLRKVTLLEGPAGAGKSQLALDLAARVTRSAPWPNGEPSSLPTADVLVVCRKNEAAAASARFERAGGDLAKLFHFCEFRTFLPADKTRETRPIAFPYDFPALEHHVEMHESFGMIIIDSLADFCRTPREVAETLVLLEELASRANVALIVTVPANCRVDAQGRLRVTSRWPTDTVRSAWCVLPDPDDPLRRLFVAKRTNFCLEPDGLAYRLSDRGVVWEARSRISPVDPLGQFRASDVCLADLLGDGALPASTVYRLGGELGFSPKQLRAAGERLGVACQRIGFSGDGHWSWSLPGPRLEVDCPNVGCVEPVEALADASGYDHVEQVSNLLVPSPASPVDRGAVDEKSEPRMVRIATNDGRGNPDAGDDAERRDGRSHAERGNEKCVVIFGESMGDGSLADASGYQPGSPTRERGTPGGDTFVPDDAPSLTSEQRTVRIATNDGRGNPDAGDDAERRDGRSHAERGNEECMGIYGESMENGGPCARPDGRSRRRRRSTKRNRKKERRLSAVSTR